MSPSNSTRIGSRVPAAGSSTAVRQNQLSFEVVAIRTRPSLSRARAPIGEGASRSGPGLTFTSVRGPPCRGTRYRPTPAVSTRHLARQHHPPVGKFHRVPGRPRLRPPPRQRGELLRPAALGGEAQHPQRPLQLVEE